MGRGGGYEKTIPSLVPREQKEQKVGFVRFKFFIQFQFIFMRV